jgi:hypothetical protein
MFLTPPPERVISPRQSRDARAWLAWTTRDLADQSGMPLPAIEAFEAGKNRRVVVRAARSAFERQGIRFIVPKPIGRTHAYAGTA